MDQVSTILQVISPIFTAVILGIYARRASMITPEQMQGLQQFVLKFGLPCVLFNSCYSASLGAESVTSMALTLPLLLLSSIWGFLIRKNKFPYHNLPMMFSSQETGMLGIPLFIALFGAEHAYRVGVLDLAQSVIAIPVIAILAAGTGKTPSVSEIAKDVARSPLLLMSLLGLALNLSGMAALLNETGFGPVITQATGFIAQPVSAAMLFSVGYNFSIRQGNRATIFRLAGLHFAVFAVFCAVMQGALFLMPSVEPETRWAVLLYCALPCSYLTPSLGRTEEEHTIASGICSILTLATLTVFCGIAIAVV